MISAQTMPVETKTLFERLDGTSGITVIVDDVIEAHMCNPAINVRFIPYKEMTERLSKIRQHTIDFSAPAAVARLNIKAGICLQHIRG
jgi:hemoglobin